MSQSKNPILAQPIEIRMWIESKCREDLTNSEILKLFEEKFPFVQGITVQNITSYRKRYIPNYKEILLERYGKKAQQTEKEVEDEILQEIREDEKLDEDFSIDEKQKLNLLKSQKTVLKEMWDNYRKIRGGTDEVGKKGYLVEISKVLSQVKELQELERSFISAMAECRKKEAQMTIGKYYDSITGWFVPRMLEKASTKEQALEYISMVYKYLEDFQKIIIGSDNISEATKELLRFLYASKKIASEESGEKEAEKT